MVKTPQQKENIYRKIRKEIPIARPSWSLSWDQLPWIRDPPALDLGSASLAWETISLIMRVSRSLWSSPMAEPRYPFQPLLRLQH